MLKKSSFAVAALFVVFVVFGAVQPSGYSVTRTVSISAPAPDIFAQVNDFHNWQAWSPWAKLDPAAKVTFEGPTAGTGAIFTWAGNDKVGEGRMTVTESRPSDLIRIRTDFVKPIEGTCISQFTFKPGGDETAVTWTLSGENGLLRKMVSLVMDMETTIGGDLQQGLAQLKSVTESAVRK